MEIVSRISLTRPQLAASVEDLLVRMGQQGQVRGQVTDEALKGLLEQVRSVLHRDCCNPRSERCDFGRPSGLLDQVRNVVLTLVQVSNPPQQKSSAPAVAAGARTKTLGGGITVSAPMRPFAWSAAETSAGEGVAADQAKLPVN
jgi:hypothetical protein